MDKAVFSRYYRTLERFLVAVAFRMKLLVAVESLLRLASSFLAVLLGSLIVEATKSWLPYFPFIYYLLGLIFLILVFGQGVWRVISGLSMQKIARRLEAAFPRLRDDVTNALLLFHQSDGPSGSDRYSEGLVNAHLRKTAAEIAVLQPKQVVDFKKLWSQGKVMLPLFMAFIVAFAVDSQFPVRSVTYIFKPLSALPERKTFLTVEPTPEVVLRGTPVAINAKASGYIPDHLSLKLWPETGDEMTVMMTSEGEGLFTHRITSAQTSFRYQIEGGRAISPVFEVGVADPPGIGEIKTTLIPPGYTRLPKTVQEDGHIKALKGTVVALDARATKIVKTGKLILNQKEQILLDVDGDHLIGNLLVFHPGTYSLKIRDELGFENANPVQYRIQLIPDKYPEGVIISPTESLELAGSEVLPLTYSAKDDFGLTTIKLIYRMAGKERSITLKSLKEVPSLGPEVFKWDLAGLSLTPGDRVSYRLEVWDNDSISGPKAGYSQTYSLVIRDEKHRAARETERAQEISDALLDLLADQLEEIKDRPALSKDITKIMEKVDKYYERMGPERPERFDLESLKRNLTTLQKRIDDLPDETVTQEMERLALLAEDIAKKTRMREVEALAREIRSRQRRLIDTLREQEGDLSSESLQALMKELESLKDLVSQVMEAFSKMANQLPDEFINNPELSNLDFKDLFNDLEEIQKRLMEGDLAGALAAAQNLLQNLSEMMAAMAQAGTQASMGAFNRLQSEMTHQVGELEKILREQKDILSKTDAMDQVLSHRMDEEIKKRLDSIQARLQDALERLRRQLPSEEGDPVADMERLLDKQQLEGLSEKAKILENIFKDSPDIRELVKEISAMLKTLSLDQKDVMTADGKEAFSDLSMHQETLRQRTQNLGEALERLSQLFPGMDTSIITDLKGGAGSMGQASGKLNQEDAPGAIPPEQEAIQRLSRSQRAMQQMARQMAMGMQAGRWGHLWGYDPRGGWYYGPYGPMPTLPQPELRRPLERGYTGLDREEFDPPSKDAYKAPQILREKVMEALKQEVPSQYRQEVERYFKGLTE